MVRVIFLENVENYKIGDIKDVPDGYARNFLFKKSLAKIASEKEVSEINAKLKEIKAEEQKRIKKAEEVAKKIEKIKIDIEKEVNEEGHLYGSLGTKEVSESLKKQGFQIEPSHIIFDEPIKDLGDYEITVRVGHGVETKLKINVKRK